MPSRSPHLTVALLATVLLPAVAHGQDSQLGARGIDLVNFASGNASAEGFSSATATVHYRFNYCGMSFGVSFQVVPGTAKGLYNYWMHGQKHPVEGHTVHIDRPNIEKLPVNVAWRGGPMKSLVIGMPSVDDSDLGCNEGSFFAVAPLSRFFPDAAKKTPTPEQIRSVIAGFSFQSSPTHVPLRHFATREAIAARLRVARQDSVRSAREKETAARDEARRRDSLARVASARQDSAAKARTTSGNGGNGGAATTASGATTSGTVAGQGRVRPGTSTSLDRNGTRTNNGAGQQPAATPRQETYDERMARQAEARRQAQRDSAVAAEQRRRMALANLERQRQETAERNARIEESSEKLAQATVGLLGSIGEIRRANAEERERKERIRQERIAQHYRDARIAYLSRPPQPRCVPASMPTSRFDLKKGTSGTITGNECELEDSTSAVRYTFTVDKPGELQVWAGGPNDFTGRIRVTRIMDGGREAGAGAHLQPGTYALYVSGLVPGETGAFTVTANYLPSYLTGGWGFGGAPFLGSFTIGEVSESGWGMIGRISYGFSERFSAVAAIDYAQAGDEFPGGWQVGGRAHLPIGSKQRIGYLQLTTGKSYVETFTGTVSAVGAGVELFSDRSMGFEIGIVKSFGSIKDADFPAGGSIDYGATMLTFGLTTR